MKANSDVSAYWVLNLVILFLVIWLGYKSILFMGVGNKTWAIVSFSVALGLAIFAVGQVVVYFVYKSHLREMRIESWSKERKKYHPKPTEKNLK